MKIGFIGVGKLGKEAAEVMAEKHFVEGYDLAEVSPSNFEMVKSLKEVCNNKDIIFIAVPTPHDPAYEGKYPSSQDGITAKGMHFTSGLIWRKHSG